MALARRESSKSWWPKDLERCLVSLLQTPDTELVTTCRWLHVIEIRIVLIMMLINLMFERGGHLLHLTSLLLKLFDVSTASRGVDHGAFACPARSICP